jgi:hypothetical protein
VFGVGCFLPLPFAEEVGLDFLAALDLLLLESDMDLRLAAAAGLNASASGF